MKKKIKGKFKGNLIEVSQPDPAGLYHVSVNGKWVGSSPKLRSVLIIAELHLKEKGN